MGFLILPKPYLTFSHFSSFSLPSMVSSLDLKRYWTQRVSSSDSRSDPVEDPCSLFPPPPFLSWSQSCPSPMLSFLPVVSSSDGEFTQSKPLLQSMCELLQFSPSSHPYPASDSVEDPYPLFPLRCF
jgi:hypothetical protein